MRCPCCGVAGWKPLTVGEQIRAQSMKLAIVVTSVGIAVFGQAELLGEPWRHVVTIGAILVAVAVSVFVNLKEQSV